MALKLCKSIEYICFMTIIEFLIRMIFKKEENKRKSQTIYRHRQAGKVWTLWAYFDNLLLKA